jgi:thymidylate synthase
MHLFEGDNVGALWEQAFAALHRGDLHSQGSRAGATRELVPAMMVLHDPRQRWVVAREPAMSVAFAIVEVIGILNGRRDSAYLNYYNPGLPKFAGMGAEYHGAYGHRLRANFGFDQLRRAFEALRANSSSRQVVLQIWDPRTDLPDQHGRPRADDVPCNICSMLKLRDGRLYWTQVMRSNDLFRGLPYNFVQFTTIQEVFAGWLKCSLGPYTHLSDSLHFYENMSGKVSYASGFPVPDNLDDLALPEEEARDAWAELNNCVNTFVAPHLTEQALDIAATMAGYPQAIRNLCYIVGADSARRRGYAELAKELSARCTNPVLRLLWDRWVDRRERKCSASALELSK